MRIRNKHNSQEHVITPKEWETLKLINKATLFKIINFDEDVMAKIPVPNKIKEFQAIVKPTKIETVTPIETPLLQKIEKTKQSRKKLKQ